MDEFYFSIPDDSKSGRRLLAGEHLDAWIAPEHYKASVKGYLDYLVADRSASGWTHRGREVVSRYRDTGEVNKWGGHRLEHLEVVGVYEVSPRAGWEEAPHG